MVIGAYSNDNLEALKRITKSTLNFTRVISRVASKRDGLNEDNLMKAFHAFLISHVCEAQSLYSKRTSNVCLLLFPCPSVFFASLCECAFVARLLILSGDVELNPGPATDAQYKELLAAISALSAKIDSRHTEVMSGLAELKEKQAQLTNQVSDLTTRLTTVESLVESLELNPSSADIPAVVAHAVKTENASLLTCLDDLEDRSRRDNLIFYGISDTPSETWAQSEKLVCEFLSHHLKFEVPENMVCRAHRLGSYTANKTRPIIMKFSCSKLKDKILALKSNLKSTGVSVGEDFCRATRQSRKKLLDFAKASGQTYSIRLNKLFLNKKCYIYCSTTDNVCEVNMPRAARSSVRSRQAIEGNGST
ncbi:uncharacterized protein [Dermacentor andersoni]|uniref:uncharacterized protein n=1 Tax=Dermacentor andersoni TaxID=34620 RepID=UPI003B3A0BCD